MIQKSLAIFVPWITQKKGGTEHVAAILGNNMVERGYKVHIYTFDSAHGKSTYDLHQEITLHSFPENYNEETEFSLLDTLARQNPDLIISLNSTRDFYYSIYCAHRLNKPIILSEHFNPISSKQLNYMNVTERELFFSSADQIHLLVDYFRLSFSEALQDRIHIIPNTVREAFTTIKSDSKSGHHILCIANLYPLKRISLLIDAIAILRQRMECSCTIVGEGPDYQQLQEQIERLGMKNCISLLGRVDNPYSLYARTDLFVLPSLTEGLPLVLIEAMAHSLPIIAFSDCSGVDQLVNNRVNGYLITDANKAEALSDKLGYLIEHPELRKKMGLASLSEYRQKYTRDIFIEKWQSLIEKTIHTNKPVLQNYLQLPTSKELAKSFSMGLKGKNYILLSPILSFLEQHHIDNIYLYGAGGFFIDTIDIFKKMNIQINAILDSRAKERTFNLLGYEVNDISKLDYPKKPCFVIMSMSFINEMKNIIMQTVPDALILTIEE